MPLLLRAAYTCPSRTPAIHAIHSVAVLPPKGSVTRHCSTPVSRFQAISESLAAPPFCGKPLSRIENTRLSSTNGAQAMTDGSVVLVHSTDGVRGPSG